MKKTLSLLLCCHTLLCMAETMPEHYYAPAQGKQDAELKSALSCILQEGERYKYGSRSETSTHLYTWDGFALTDRRANGTIYDMYSPYRHHFAHNNRSAAGMAIEHAFPKSWWGGEDNDAYKDLFHLNPSEHRANGAKSDYPPGVADSLTIFDNGVFRTGSGKGNPNFRVWEPADRYKGDFARAYFYVATCYEDFHWTDTIALTSTGNESLASTSGAYFAMDNNSHLEFKPWLTDILLDWHRQDPVSEKEIRRQDAISTIQHNRNPYIDYPELVEYIWGDKQGQTVDFSLLTSTCSDAYTAPIDTDNIEAYGATAITEDGFVAQWKEAGTEQYELNIYTKTLTGHSDTLINMPAVTANLIAKTEHVAWSGTNSTSDGSCAMLLGTAKQDYIITLSDIDAQEPTRLVVRANISKYDTEATLLIQNDTRTLEEIVLSFDETFYTIPIPPDTRTITLQNGRKGKRVSLQNLYLISGNLKIEAQHLQGYPAPVSGTCRQVKTQLHTLQPVYYQVTPQGLASSNEVSVYYNDISTRLRPTENTPLAYSISNRMLTLSQLPANAEVALFDMSGNMLYRTRSTTPTLTFRLPETGVYILQVNGTQQKVVSR